MVNQVHLDQPMISMSYWTKQLLVVLTVVPADN
jgi:hypothetical protein